MLVKVLVVNIWYILKGVIVENIIRVCRVKEIIEGK